MTDFLITSPVAKIRNRVSYKEFKELYKLIKKEKIKDVLVKVHEMIDRRSGFGSITNSNAARESIEQLIHDEKTQSEVKDTGYRDLLRYKSPHKH